jgi:hypothetical protein
MKKNIFVLLLSFVFISLNITGARAEDIAAARLIKEIKDKGAKAVLEELTVDDDWNKFLKVCGKIKTGNKEWLEVARLLYPSSDAGASESLEASVAQALSNAPRQVLELIAESEHSKEGKFTVGTVCISPFIEPEPGVEEKFLRGAEKALKSLNTSDNPRLNKLRIQCLKNIQKDISH